MRRAGLLLVLLALFPASGASAAPAPAISVSAASGPAPLTVRFTADAAVVDPAPAIVSYAWSFGDGTTGAGQSVAHRFLRAGSFTVFLTVTDALGGTATATTRIEAQALRLRLAPAAVVFGRRTIARGALVPARAGAGVVIERRSFEGWVRIAAATTDSAGRFNARLRPARTGVLRARIGVIRSAPERLTVAPELKARAGAGVAFVGAPLVVRSPTGDAVVVHGHRPSRGQGGRPDARPSRRQADGADARRRRVRRQDRAGRRHAHRAALGPPPGRFPTGRPAPMSPRSARASPSCTSTFRRRRPPSTPNSSTASSRSRRRAASTAPAPSTRRRGAHSPRTWSPRPATAERAPTSRSRRAARS